MKSIKSFLIAVMGSLVFAVCLLSTFIAFGFARATSIDIIYGDLMSLADAVSNYIAADIEKEMAVLQALAFSDALTSATSTLEEKAEYLVSYRDLDPSRVAYTPVDIRGDGVTTDGIRVNVADREYFKRVTRGESVVTEPIENRAIPGMFISVYAVPIRDRQTGAITGALVLDLDARYLSDLLARIPIGQNGGPYVISNATGNTIGHFRYEERIDNVERAADTDSSLADLAALHALARTGARGVSKYSYWGFSCLVAYVQLPSDYCEWSVMCSSLLLDFTKGIYVMLAAMIIAALVLCAIGIVVAAVIATSIAKPILVIRDGLEGIAQGGGDLTVRLEEKGNNEIAAISKSFNKFTATISIVADGYFLPATGDKQELQ